MDGFVWTKSQILNPKHQIPNKFKIKNPLRYPECADELTEPRQFNLIIKTFIELIEDKSSAAYLRVKPVKGFILIAKMS